MLAQLSLSEIIQIETARPEFAAKMATLREYGVKVNGGEIPILTDGILRVSLTFPTTITAEEVSKILVARLKKG